MIIIVAAQLINTACGPAGNTLEMTGFEKYAFLSMFAGSITNIALNCLLIPWYGITGAAIANGCGIVICNLMMVYFVQRKLKINPAVWGMF
jgi:O-antigen/teichoic acid export membrane protein